MKRVTITEGVLVPCLGQGTWKMGERSDRRLAEIKALRTGIDLDMTLIDTAEMYGDGATEELVGEALAGCRNEAFLVTKAYPQNAGSNQLSRACENSLRRLRTDRLDLYLLHWRGRVPLAETAEAMEALQAAGKIRHWGVSNLDVDDMDELVAAGGGECVTDQILYNLTRRGPQRELLPWLANHGMSAMAYSPVEQGRLIDNPNLQGLAAEAGCTSPQLALAWVLSHEGMIAIPKAGLVEHVAENRAAADIVIPNEIMDRLDAAFPPHRKRVPLEML